MVFGFPLGSPIFSNTKLTTFTAKKSSTYYMSPEYFEIYINNNLEKINNNNNNNE